MTADLPQASPAGGWTFIVHGPQRIPVHCGGMADDLDLGLWECRHCETQTHVRDIPGWRESATRG